MKKGLLAALAIAALLIGAAAMAYPAISNAIFENRADSLVEKYDEEVDAQDESRLSYLYGLADEYNRIICSNTAYLVTGESLSEAEISLRRFLEEMDITGSGVIGSVEIPSIDVSVPIFASTDDELALRRGAGLMEGTSLPAGGKGTHAVICAHSGLTDAKLFTDLPLVEEGDLFKVNFLGRDEYYEVDNVAVVFPSETELLKVSKDEDYVTLLTCTPYGVNTHRLLVRGRRTEKAVPQETPEEHHPKEAANSEWRKYYGKALIAGGAVLTVLVVAGGLVVLNVKRKRTRRRRIG